MGLFNIFSAKPKKVSNKKPFSQTARGKKFTAVMNAKTLKTAKKIRKRNYGY